MKRLSGELDGWETRPCPDRIANRIFYLAIPPQVFVGAMRAVKAATLTDRGLSFRAPLTFIFLEKAGIAS